MERRTIIILGFLFCLLGIFIAPLFYENRPYEEIIFLIIMYPLPAYILSLLNGYLLKFTELSIKGIVLKVGIGLCVLVFLAFLANGKESPVQFIGAFGIVGIGITNLIWIIKLVRKKPYANNTYN